LFGSVNFERSGSINSNSLFPSNNLFLECIHLESELISEYSDSSYESTKLSCSSYSFTIALFNDKLFGSLFEIWEFIVYSVPSFSQEVELG
jgi:hypothetical protein